MARRDFLVVSGSFSIAVAAGVARPGKAECGDDIKSDYPVSKGYILVDTRKCQGCLTCMLACSLANDGRVNLSLSRIQVMQNPFGKFPHDISVEQCRQCVEPKCVESCPTEAIVFDKEHGNIRTIDYGLCVGCLDCIPACQHQPSRAIWNFEDDRAEKCDLCAGAKHWKKGGPGGKQACIEVCPVNAIRFENEVPVQEGDAGYKVNLRGEAWGKLGYPTD